MVATTVERRLKALETSEGAGDKCLGCGFGRDERPPWTVRIVGRGEAEPDRWCEECGRKLAHNVNLHWGHDSQA